MDPLVGGDYPLSMKGLVGNRLPRFTKKQSEMLKGATSSDSTTILHTMLLIFLQQMGLTLAITLILKLIFPVSHQAK